MSNSQFAVIALFGRPRVPDAAQRFLAVRRRVVLDVSDLEFPSEI